MPEALSPGQVRALLNASGSVLGRFSGPELYFTQNLTLTAPSTVTPPKNVPLTRPLSHILIKTAYRVTVATNPYTTVSPEAFPNLLQQIQLQGIHKDFGNLTTIKMSGATAYCWPFLFQQRGSQTLIGSTAATQQRVADPDKPMVSAFTGQIGTYDVITFHLINLGPMMGLGQSLKRQGTNFYYQPLHWNDSLQLQLNYGDHTAFGNPGTASVTFSGFGGTGNPTVAVHNVYSLLGPFANRMRSGVVVRSENTLTTLQSLATNQQIQVLQKNITPNVLVKSFLAETTGISANVQTPASLSDLMLDQTQILVDNKPVRWNQDNLAAKAWYEAQFGVTMPTGYLLQSFVDGQNPLLSYRGDGLQAGTMWELKTNVLTASAANRVSVVQEQIYGGPFPALRGQS